MFKKNKEEFYLKYLCERTFPRYPQNQAMASGSAFDAYAKSHLHNVLIGDKDPKFKLETLFEAQVEAPLRKWAWSVGRFLFTLYEEYGGLSNLLLEMNKSIGPVRFEMDVHGAIEGSRESKTGTVGKVPLLGKPDIFFINKDGCPIIVDWKVNGYVSKQQVSPMQGYLHLLPGLAMHKDCIPGNFRGFRINTNPDHELQILNESYARQLSIYAWLCGVEIGEKFVAGIDQVCCDPTKEIWGERAGVYGPKIRFAQHRTTISAEYQYTLRDDIQHIWYCCSSGHFFPDLTLAESQSRCNLIEQAFFSEDLGLEGPRG